MHRRASCDGRRQVVTRPRVMLGHMAVSAARRPEPCDGHGLVCPRSRSSPTPSARLRPLPGRLLPAVPRVEPQLPPTLRPAHGRIAALVRRRCGATSGSCCAASRRRRSARRCSACALRDDLRPSGRASTRPPPTMMPHLLFEMALRAAHPRRASRSSGSTARRASPRWRSAASWSPPAGATGLRFSASHLAAVARRRRAGAAAAGSRGHAARARRGARAASASSAASGASARSRTSRPSTTTRSPRSRRTPTRPAITSTSAAAPEDGMGRRARRVLRADRALPARRVRRDADDAARGHPGRLRRASGTSPPPTARRSARST